MILVSGSNVTSVRNGFPSTWPTISNDSCLETGNSGLVMLVGSEKVGIVISTRLLSGATGISPGMTGWGIILDPLFPGVVVDAVEPAPVAALPELSSFIALISDPHASTTDRLANTTITATPRATGLMRLPPVIPPLQSHVDQLQPLRRTLHRNFQDGPYPRSVVLLLGDIRLERRPLIGHQDVIEGTVRYGGRSIPFQRPSHVLCDALVVLLAVGVADLGISGHDDTRLGSVLPGFPGPLAARDLAVLVLLGVLSEVPDVAFLVLGVPV